MGGIYSMGAILRAFTSEPGFTEDFCKVRDFLRRIHDPAYSTANWDWVRWEWVQSLPYLDETKLSRIGVWEDEGRVVALANYEFKLGDAYFSYDPEYACLKRDMVEHAMRHLASQNEDGCRALQLDIGETDYEFIEIVKELGFTPAESAEHISVFYNTGEVQPAPLPAGYSVVSMAEENDLHKLNRVLWRGFNQPGEAPETEIPGRIKSQSGPDFRKDLALAVKAPNGDFVSYCGMWHAPDTDYAVVEPVATDPDYRRMGLGKAVVSEGVRRCFAEGAKVAYVGSGQQFYYSIGFEPLATTRKWSRTW